MKTPWHTEPSINPHETHIVDADGLSVATVYGRQEAPGVPDLFVAAPDVLTALIDAREELRLCREKDGAGPYDPTLKVRIDAAIAKAGDLR